MEFGVPSKRRTVKEKYPETPVITLLPFEGENTSRKMEFNKKAYEVMGLDPENTNEVAFSFNKSNYADNSIVNVNGFSIESALNLAKNHKVSNKAHYEELKKRYDVSLEEELELTIVDSGAEFQGNKVFKLVTVKSLEEANPLEEQVPPAASDIHDEQPDEATKAKLDEEDYIKQHESPGNPWEEVDVTDNAGDLI